MGVGFLQLLFLAFNKYPLKLSGTRRQAWPYFLAVIPVLWAILFYYRWSFDYNTASGSYYFLMKLMPIGAEEGPRIPEVLQGIFKGWFRNYPLLFMLSIICLVFNLRYLKVLHPFWRVLYAAVLVGGLSYSLLWFNQFKDHDYYILALVPVWLMSLLLSYSILQKKGWALLKANSLAGRW